MRITELNWSHKEPYPDLNVTRVVKIGRFTFQVNISPVYQISETSLREALLGHINFIESVRRIATSKYSPHC